MGLCSREGLKEYYIIDKNDDYYFTLNADNFVFNY